MENIAHEMAHLVLEYAFTLPIDTSGCCNLDRDIEKESTWLGATILISDEAAIHFVRAASTLDACRTYGVSGALLRMRVNASGARIRVGPSYN